ncbi:hypothetical protein ACFFOM_00575 [Microlunatus capsulatus]|uniref:EfeO-type cupredoxin-like domain-containing protein n=1 Tax=Microlunatus capsulatus TaxID=99117 RepID=A0ABS4Z472_9ACTN|nr:hypothetical protein [Microlunatus capsulatus]MBP2415789.1 hypothetical protein [Microlunatus capsulatus]
MSSTQPNRRPGAPTSARRPSHRAAALLAAALLGLGLSACTSSAEPAGPATSAPAGGASSAASTPAAPAADALTVDITIAGGDVTPNGQKLDVAVGQEVVLNVTSDEDDEIHAHTGGDGYELEVEAGQPATGSFTLGSAGSFEVESHHLEKVIVVLNAR